MSVIGVVTELTYARY